MSTSTTRGAIEYVLIYNHLSIDQARKAYSKVACSEKFKLDDLGHIFLRGTDLPVGYIGDDSLELCRQEGVNPQFYSVPHKHLKRIFKGSH